VHIIVCLKRVPDTETRIRVDSTGTRIDSTGG
jgi:electron transfer flavoprotein alpha/beta subunit